MPSLSSKPQAYMPSLSSKPQACMFPEFALVQRTQKSTHSQPTHACTGHAWPASTVLHVSWWHTQLFQCGCRNCFSKNLTKRRSVCREGEYVLFFLFFFKHNKANVYILKRKKVYASTVSHANPPRPQALKQAEKDWKFLMSTENVVGKVDPTPHTIIHRNHQSF